MSSPRRIIFFGTSSFAVPALKQLAALAGTSVVLVVTQPDEPVGRKQTMSPPPVKGAAERLGIPVWQPKTLKDDDAPRIIARAKPHVGVVASYGKIIPDPVLNVFPHGLLNIHPSLLPAYRGPSPIQNAILHNDTETGVTIMKVDSGVDHGPIVTRITHPLRGDESAPELTEKLATLGAELLAKTLIPYLDGRAVPKKQNHGAATFTRIITRDDGRVDQNMTPQELFRRYRAYHPWPGIWTSLTRGSKKIRVKLTEALLRDGTLLIRRVQPEGKPEMSYDEFLRGYRTPLFGEDVRDN